MTQTVLLMLIHAHRFQVIKHSIKTSLLFVFFFASQLPQHTGKCQWGEVLAVPSLAHARDMHSPHLHTEAGGGRRQGCLSNSTL